MFKTLSYLFVSYGWSQSGGDTNISVPIFVIAPSIYTSPLTTEEFNDLVERVLSVRQSQQKADVTENLMNTIIIITNKYIWQNFGFLVFTDLLSVSMNKFLWFNIIFLISVKPFQPR